MKGASKKIVLRSGSYELTLESLSNKRLNTFVNLQAEKVSEP